MSYWEPFPLVLPCPSTLTHMQGACFCSYSLWIFFVSDIPSRASSTAHGSDCKSLFRNSNTCHSQAVILSLSHTRIHSHTSVWGSLWRATVDKSQLYHPTTTCWPCPHSTDRVERKFHVELADESKDCLEEHLRFLRLPLF